MISITQSRSCAQNPRESNSPPSACLCFTIFTDERPQGSLKYPGPQLYSCLASKMKTASWSKLLSIGLPLLPPMAKVSRGKLGLSFEVEILCLLEFFVLWVGLEEKQKPLLHFIRRESNFQQGDSTTFSLKICG